MRLNLRLFMYVKSPPLLAPSYDKIETEEVVDEDSPDCHCDGLRGCPLSRPKQIV